MGTCIVKTMANGQREKREPEELFDRVVVTLETIQVLDAMMCRVKAPEQRDPVLRAVKPVIDAIVEDEVANNQQKRHDP